MDQTSSSKIRNRLRSRIPGVHISTSATFSSMPPAANAEDIANPQLDGHARRYASCAVRISHQACLMTRLVGEPSTDSGHCCVNCRRPPPLLQRIRGRYDVGTSSFLPAMPNNVHSLTCKAPGNRRSLRLRAHYNFLLLRSIA